MRTAFGVWRCAGAHSPGSSSCMPRYIAALACIFSRPWPGLASTSTRRSAFSIGVSSPAFSSSGRSASYDQCVARVLRLRLARRQHRRRLGHSGTRFCALQRRDVVGGQVFEASRVSFIVVLRFGGSGGEAVVGASSRTATPSRRRSAPASGPSTARCAPGARRPWRGRCGPSRAPTARCARCARRASAGSASKAVAEVVVVHAQRLAERDRVFQRHAGALGQVLQRRVRGVAEQRGAAEGPLADRLAVGGGPALPVLRQVDQLARLARRCLRSSSAPLRGCLRARSTLPARGCGR